jgi:hypothetical protein
MGFRMRRISRHAFFELRQPHIGETTTKTNAIREPRTNARRIRERARRQAFESGFLRLFTGRG